MAEKNILLKELKGQIISVTLFNTDNMRHENYNLRFLDTDKAVIKVEDYGHNIHYFPLNAMPKIEKADKENEQKFLDYENELKANPDFKGDYEEDKGYTVIKSKKRFLKQYEKIR